MLSFVLFAIALGAALFVASAYREERLRDASSLRTAWLLLAASLPLAALGSETSVWPLTILAWVVAAIAFVFLHFALDPMFPPEPKSKRRDEPRKPPAYEPIMPPPD